VSASSIDRALEILRSGGVVGIPTETVYGLAADATDSGAVKKIFSVKGRPGTNPLIVHVHDAAVARRCASVWDRRAEELARRFWPGPLTLVVPKAQSIVPEVTAGLQTVGLRAPDHPVALELLREFDGALAAPSANRSNRISPTTADHVRQELGEQVELVLDGGPCRVGIESTVLDLSRPVPSILRPGAITVPQIAEIIGPVTTVEASISPLIPAISPGQQPVHYAPTKPAIRFTIPDAPKVADWCCRHVDEPAAFLVLDHSPAMTVIEQAAAPGHAIWTMPAEPGDYARAVYATLRQADATEATILFLELPPPDPPWQAVRDRLQRATRPL
jgi:L-threonylcarbamoyladenylate synthase